MRVVISIEWHAAWHQVTPPNRTSSTEWEAIVQLGISQNMQSDSGAHQATRVPRSEIKQTGSKAHNSPSSSAKVAKWRLPGTVAVRLYVIRPSKIPNFSDPSCIIHPTLHVTANLSALSRCECSMLIQYFVNESWKRFGRKWASWNQKNNNFFAEYNQQDATFINVFISVRRCTCFDRFSIHHQELKQHIQCQVFVRPILLATCC